MNQLTLRQIPEPLASTLRQKAVESGTSQNKTIISVLKKALNLDQVSTGSHTPRRDLNSVFSRPWTKKESAEFKKNTAPFERIDTEMWK